MAGLGGCGEGGRGWERRVGVSEGGVAAGVVAVLGLGEAGSAIGRDLLAAGVVVRGYDPVVAVPEGMVATGSDAEACSGADLVLSLTTAHEAEAAFRASVPGLQPGVLFADLNTSAADLKQRLADLAGQRGIAFADVAMMAPVPGRGIRTPMLVSGDAAAAVAAALTSFGGNAEVISGPAGAAASRKLCRSVFYKGMAAAVTESPRAARPGCARTSRATSARTCWTASSRAASSTRPGAPTRWPRPPNCWASWGSRPGSRRPAATGWRS